MCSNVQITNKDNKMKKIALAVLAAVGISAACSDPNHYVLTLKVKQSTFTLSISEHIKNSMNAIEFNIPVEKSFWESQSIGSELSNRWKPGSLIFNGDFSKLKVTVTNKTTVRRPECR